MASLYPAVSGVKPMANDLDQLIETFTGIADAGALALLGEVAAPGAAPAVTLSAGSLTGTYGWSAYWVTGVLTGNGSTRNITGRTVPGPALTGQSLSSQEATVSIASLTIPTGVIGWGVVRTKAGGNVYYEVPSSEQFMTSYGGSLPTTFIDDTPDSSLVTAAPTSNTTGTSLSGILNLLSGSSVSGTISGSPTLSGGWLFGDTLGTDWNIDGATTFTPPNGAASGTFFGWNQSAGSRDSDIICVTGSDTISLALAVLWASGTAAPYTLTRILTLDTEGNLVANTLTSTVATGIAPFSVASTTQVANLNAATAGQAGNATQWGGANNDIQNVGNTATPTTTSTSYVSAGIGLSLAPSTTRIQVLGMLTNGLSGVTATSGGIAIYRNATGVPASGTSVGTDTLIASVFGNTATISPAYLDTGLTAGTTYYYYVAIASGQSGYSWGGTATFSIASR